MSRLHATQLKLIGASSAALLIAGAAAAPAMAAPTTVDYNCGILSSLPVTLDLGTLPTSLVAGQKVKQKLASGTVNLNADTVGLAQAQGWASVGGSLTADGSDGTTVYKLTIATTQVPTTPTPLDIPTTGVFTIQASKAGKYKITAGASTAFIQGYDASGGELNSVTLACAAPKGDSGVLGTVKVSKDKTKTKVSTSVAKTSVKAKAKVKSHFGLKATGKVSFSLMSGKKMVGSAKGKLSKSGVAKVTFKNVTKAGKYTVKAVFKGDKALKGSKGTHSVKVK